MSRVRRIKDHYVPRIVPGRKPHDILDWSDASAQTRRFQVLADNLPLTGARLLDVGCGLADLLGYLTARGIAPDYTGVDLVEEMLAMARQRFPRARLLCLDVFADPPPLSETFDVVFCSGIFNLDLGNNLEFLPWAMRRLASLATRATVINLLHCRAPVRHEGYCYYAPRQVMALLEPLSRGDSTDPSSPLAGGQAQPTRGGCKLELLEDYLANDFTVICRAE